MCPAPSCTGWDWDCGTLENNQPEIFFVIGWEKKNFFFAHARRERKRKPSFSLSLLRTTIPTLPASACEWRADRCELRVCSDGVDICNYITGELRKIYTTIITTTTTPRTLKVSRKLCHFWLFALTRSSPTRGDKKGDRITINISPRISLWERQQDHLEFVSIRAATGTRQIPPVELWWSEPFIRCWGVRPKSYENGQVEYGGGERWMPRLDVRQPKR